MEIYSLVYISSYPNGSCQLFRPIGLIFAQFRLSGKISGANTNANNYTCRDIVEDKNIFKKEKPEFLSDFLLF